MMCWLKIGYVTKPQKCGPFGIGRVVLGEGSNDFEPTLYVQTSIPNNNNNNNTPRQTITIAWFLRLAMATMVDGDAAEAFSSHGLQAFHIEPQKMGWSRLGIAISIS